MTTLTDTPRLVTGRITDDSGVHAAELSVRAVDRDLRSAEVLGEGRTDDQGRFAIEYRAADGGRGELGRVDVQVVVPDPDDPEGVPLLASEIRFNAAEQETFDLVLPAPRRGLSELERMRARLEPVLDGVPLTGLREDEEHQDFTFLAAETSIPRARIVWLSLAAVAERRLDSVPLEAFYAWFRAGLPADGEAVLALPPWDLMVVLKRAVGENVVPARLVDRFDALDRWLRGRRSTELLAPAERGQEATVGDLVGLARDTERLTSAQRDDFVAAVARTPADGMSIAAAVARLNLDQPQLRALRDAVALRGVTGADPALMRAASALLPALGDGCDKVPFAAVAALTTEEWTQAVTAAAPDLDNASATARATACQAAVARLFPQDTYLAPAARRPDRTRLANLLRRRSPALTDLVHGFPGLRLEEVLAGSGKVSQKAAEVDRRLGLLAATYARNADVPLLELDYLPDGDASRRLNLTGLDDADRALLLDTFKTLRRIDGVTDNAAEGQKVLRAGYASAVALAGTTAERLAAQAGLDETAARRIIAAAAERATETALRFFAATDALRSPRFGSLAPGRGKPAEEPGSPVGAYFTRIPGYRELFGEQAYCACSPCRSVLSPAAYFVDLMRFVERRIASVAFADQPDDHPLRLRVRRPDLWTLPLSCANTDELVPTLDIVNTVLETHVRGALGDPSGRDAVYRRLARAGASTGQPFHLHLERVAGHLALLGHDRIEVAQALGSDAVTVARSSLGASAVEWDLLVRPRTGDTAFLERLFGPAVRGLTPTARVDMQDLLAATGWSREEFDALLATVFVRGADRPRVRVGNRTEDSVQNDVEWLTGLTYGVLDRLHRARRLSRAVDVPPGGLDLLLAAAPSAGEDDTARVMAFDTLNRVARRLRLPVEETCALVGPLPVVPAEPGGTALFDRLFNLDPFAAQQGKWPQALPVTFVHPSFTTGGTSAPDNRTLQRLTAGLGVDDAGLVTLLELLGLATAQSPSVVLTPEVLTLLYRHAVLARALGVSVADFGRLLRLSSAGAVDATSEGGADAGVDTETRTDTDAGADAPSDPRPAHRIRSLTDLVALLAAHDDWRALRFPLDDAQFVIEGDAVTDRHPNAASVARTATERLARERPWEFADTVLIAVPGISEEDSRRILATNTATSPGDAPESCPLEQAPDSSRLRLRAGVDPEAAGFTLTVPVGLALPQGTTATDLAEVLVPFDPIDHVLSALAAALGRPLEVLAELLRISGPPDAISRPLDADRTAVTAAAYTADRTALRTAALDPRPVLLRAAVLLSGPGWDAAAIRVVADDRARTDPVGIVFTKEGVHLVWQALVAARAVDLLATEPSPGSGTTGLPPLRRSALLRVLAAADWSTPSQVADLAAVLGTDIARIAALQPHLPLGGAPPVERLRRLRTALHLAVALGISGETLRTLVPVTGPGGLAPENLNASADAEFTALGQGADALYGVLRTRHPDVPAFTARLEPFEDALRARRRDALVDFLLHPGDHPVQLRFENRSELYGYLLLDIETGGCARTSWIAAATQSLQLYVHRVLMGLEAPMWNTVTPARRDAALAAIRVEWPWRRYHRVWAGNRRIYLAPENYLEADLRDDRTPLFDEVVEELAQEQLSDDTVTAAYTRYLEGFDELAALRVVGAFHDTEGGADQLHLIASTTSDPPECYHRTVTGLWTSADQDGTPRPVFGPWRKTGIRLPVAEVTPAVIGGRLHVFWLESATRPVNLVRKGNSVFAGYDHQITTRFSTAQSTGRWSAPQQLDLLDFSGTVTPVLPDRLVGWIPAGAEEFVLGWAPQLAYDLGPQNFHYEPRDDYRLPGPLLPVVHLDVWTGGIRDVRGRIAGQYRVLDLFRHQARAVVFDEFAMPFARVDDVLCAANDELYAHAVSHDGFQGGSATGHMYAAELTRKARETGRSWQIKLATLPGPARTLLVRRTLPRPHTGRLGFAVVVESGDQPLLALTTGGIHRLVPLGTGLRGRLSRQLYDSGVAGLLSTAFQEAAKEPPLQVTPEPGRLLVTPAPSSRGRLDTEGPFGTYLREMWCELPYLFAGQHNARQQFAAAQRAYHFLFDPTSDGNPTDPDRMWRYRGFRGATVQSMREVLTDSAALHAYRTDPFNPYAIARLRPGTYQRAVVLRYLDNLLDWGDALFTEFTRESLNEATMLYVLAADILGPRPPQVGQCDNGQHPPTYADIERDLDENADFLIELELFDKPFPKPAEQSVGRHFQLDRILFAHPSARIGPRPAVTAEAAEADGAQVAPEVPAPATASAPISFDPAQRSPWWNQLKGPEISGALRPQILDMLEQIAVKRPAFCLPANRELLALWDRVEDRLHKIRNCKDLTGAQRQPALFEPEIDPLLLARARAAGLTAEDALEASGGSVPPYRFTFLIDRAKQYAQTAQAFGNALYGAIERKDVAELTRLHAVQERNLMEMRTRLMEWEITATQETLIALERQREAVDTRREYYADLRDKGLSGSERVQQISRHTAAAGHLTAAGLAATAAGLGLIPQGGSFFAMTYGGIQLEGSMGRLAGMASNIATAADTVSGSAGLEATFQRRDQDWAHQHTLAPAPGGGLSEPPCRGRLSRRAEA
ncbi:neuraminidase-like domain-containing protein [Streptomyces chartreusis]